MKNILFICNGNVGRSQFAEAFYNKLIRKHGAISAGINPPQSYNYPSEKNIQIMKEVGIDISKSKVKMIHKKMLYDVKRVISFVKKQQLPGYVLEFKNLIFWSVKDPHYFDLNGRRKIRDTIKKKILKLRY